MFEAILHFFGFCPDHTAHLNILDIFIYGIFGGAILKAKAVFYIIKNKFAIRNKNYE
jgi:hypothetical protein